MNCSVCVLYTFRIAREMVLLASSYFCYFSNISTILPQNLLLYIIIFFFFFPFFLFTHFRVRLFAHFYCSLSLSVHFNIIRREDGMKTPSSAHTPLSYDSFLHLFTSETSGFVAYIRRLPPHSIQSRSRAQLLLISFSIPCKYFH